MNSLIDFLQNAANKKNEDLINLEVALPIMFIIIFLIILLIIYFVKEVLIQKKKICLSKRDSTRLSQRKILSVQSDYNQIRILHKNKFDDSSYHYYEEPRAGYYHVQKLNSYTHNLHVPTFKRQDGIWSQPVVCVKEEMSNNEVPIYEDSHKKTMPGEIINQDQATEQSAKKVAEKLCSSVPNKIGSFTSFKMNKNNYLKNLNAFKSKGCMSIGSIFEKVNAVSTWKLKIDKNTTTNANQVNDSSTEFNLQANSLILSNSSSLNSQLTKLMQTNNFGSIMANFGSASMKCQNVSRINRHRTFSDDNVLSEADNSRINMSEINSNNIIKNKNLPNESTHSVSFTRLAKINNRFPI